MATNKNSKKSNNTQTKKDSTTEFSEAISDAIGWFGSSTLGTDSSTNSASTKSDFGGSWAK